MTIGPSRAFAFSDPAKFTLPPLEGGGGGRFFTGSPADGFTCAVCHRGGTTPKLNIAGLPHAGYTPAQTYDIEVTFARRDKAPAMSLEFLTQNGQHAGTVELLDTTEIDATGYCSQDSSLDIAAYVTDVGSRRIVGLADCGAGSLRFRFTAPDEPAISFSLAMVASNGKGDPEGDGTAEVALMLQRAGERRPGVTGASSCSTLSPRPPGEAPFLIWLVPAAVWLRRRRPGGLLVAGGLGLALALPACARVAPYERGTLARRDMALAADADLTAGEEHGMAYREGSSGGGSAKGGGCGCN